MLMLPVLLAIMGMKDYGSGLTVSTKITVSDMRRNAQLDFHHLPVVEYQLKHYKKGSKMTIGNNTYSVGDLFTTFNSKVTGRIQEIVPNASGSVRVRLDVDGQDRWTTVKLA